MLQLGQRLLASEPHVGGRRTDREATAVASLEINAKIRVRNLDFFYTARQALFHVTMTVRSNTVTAFIGPSGCGKSTLISRVSNARSKVAAYPFTTKEPILGVVKMNDLELVVRGRLVRGMDHVVDHVLKVGGVRGADK